MATEYSKDLSYYADDRNKFIDIHTSIKVAIESFLATELFKGDFSRIQYSNQNICFRKRVENVDSSEKDMDNIKPINLNLPFASFFQSSDFDDDDRPASIQAAQSIDGEYIESLGRRLRSTAVKATYKATAFFARRDDIRMAHQLLYWEKTPKAPIWIYNIVLWQGHKLAIPCFITIESVGSHTDYQETDWLEKSRIFPLDIEMTVRTYEILIPNVRKIIDLPVRWGNKYSSETFDSDSDDNIYITQEAILVWANKKWDFNTDVKNIDTSSTEVQANAAKYFSDKQYTQSQLEEMCGHLPNYQTNDIIEGYWSETEEVSINKIKVSGSTDTTVTIDCRIKPADYKYFSNIAFYIPGHDDIIGTDPRQTTYTITGLYPNSTYDIKVVTTGSTGVKTTYSLSASTLDSEKNEAPSKEKVFKKGNSLVGMKF